MEEILKTTRNTKMHQEILILTRNAIDPELIIQRESNWD
jgi:hypothetical protein